MTPILSVEISPSKLRRARRGRSTPEVAELIGISRQHLWKIETGQSKPSAEIVARLCLLYGVDIRDLTRRATAPAAA